MHKAKPGMMYFEGLGVPQNYAKKLSRGIKGLPIKGNAYAQCNLGYMYCGGFGVMRNDIKASN